MQGRKYINLVEIGLVVLEICKAEFSNFTVPVNNTLVCHVYSFVFLATETLLCVLIMSDLQNCCSKDRLFTAPWSPCFFYSLLGVCSLQKGQKLANRGSHHHCLTLSHFLSKIVVRVFGCLLNFMDDYSNCLRNI